MKLFNLSLIILYIKRYIDIYLLYINNLKTQNNLLFLLFFVQILLIFFVNGFSYLFLYLIMINLCIFHVCYACVQLIDDYVFSNFLQKFYKLLLMLIIIKVQFFF